MPAPLIPIALVIGAGLVTGLVAGKLLKKTKPAELEDQTDGKQERKQPPPPAEKITDIKEPTDAEKAEKLLETQYPKKEGKNDEKPAKTAKNNDADGREGRGGEQTDPADDSGGSGGEGDGDPAAAKNEGEGK